MRNDSLIGCVFSLEIVRGRQSDFDFFLSGDTPDPTPVIEHFVQKPILNNQCDVSLQMYYCASSVSLDARVLVGLGEFPVESNEMAMRRTGN